MESRVGHGTTFMIYLPCIPWDIAGEVQAEESLPHGQGRLLLVDDEPCWSVWATLLTQLGYDVTAYTSSVSALAAFQAAPTTLTSSSPITPCLR